MMKKFLLVVCGSFVGVFLAMTFFVLSAIVFSIAMMSMGSKMNGAAKVQNNSILHIDLSGSIDEREAGRDFDYMAMMMSGKMEETCASLATLKQALKEAKTNDKIKGVYLECNGSDAAPATREELRAALADFKTSGKFIYAYGNEGYSQGDYYLASVADSLFLNPVGAVDVHGMASNTPYMKGLLDKAGVEMQVIRVGSFKSAVEPYMLSEMSPENRLQQEQYLGNIWKNLSDSMSASRKISPEKFNQLTDSIIITMRPKDLVKNHLVDKLCYKHEMESTLKKLTDVDEADDLNLVDPYTLTDGIKMNTSSDQIAILYAVGEIDGAASMLGGRNDGIDSESLCEEIADLAEDDDVKGLVLRVNSPGGSAFGSEQIWEALEQFKKTGKPFAVSMGDYAASGGYYISSGADRIFADRTTITGSIGIFGMIPCFETLLEEKLGVHLETVKTNENSDMGIGPKRLTPVQMQALQNMVNEGYELFTNRCATGRKVSQDSIKTIAEGRVWDATKAKEIGLVDEFGTIANAVEWVAKKAGLKEGKYSTATYPNAEADWKSILGNYMTMRYQSRMEREMGIFYDYYRQLNQVLNRSRILCLMEPVNITD